MLPKFDVAEFMQIIQTSKTDPDQVIQQLRQTNISELNTIVSRTCGEPVTVQSLEVSLLGGLDSSLRAGGTYCVRGTAVTADNRQRDWSIFVKNLRSLEGLPLPDGTSLSREWTEIQDGFIYWQREALAAKFNLSSSLPQGLVAPQCWAATNMGDGQICLWQEMLSVDDYTWSWSDYREAANRLGQWHGTTPAAQTLPGQNMGNIPWLSQNWLSSWVEGSLVYIIEMIESMQGWQHPYLLTYFDADELKQLQKLWEERYLLLTSIASLPKTLCHLDAHRANMMWLKNDLSLLDWSFVGQAALGEELAAFVGATLWSNHVPLDDAERLESVAFDGYLAGLQASGWQGTPDQIRQAYNCHMPLRYAFNALFNIFRTAIDPGFGENWEQKSDKPLAEILRNEANYICFLLSRSARVLQIA